MGTDEQKLVRVRDVARQLDVSQSTVWRWIYSGDLPAVQLGGRGHTVRVDQRELREWIYRDAASGAISAADDGSAGSPSAEPHRREQR